MHRNHLKEIKISQLHAIICPAVQANVKSCLPNAKVTWHDFKKQLGHVLLMTSAKFLLNACKHRRCEQNLMDLFIYFCRKNFFLDQVMVGKSEELHAEVKMYAVRQAVVFNTDSRDQKKS